MKIGIANQINIYILRPSPRIVCSNTHQTSGIRGIHTSKLRILHVGCLCPTYTNAMHSTHTPLGRAHNKKGRISIDQEQLRTHREANSPAGMCSPRLQKVCISCVMLFPVLCPYYTMRRGRTRSAKLFFLGFPT